MNKINALIQEICPEGVEFKSMSKIIFLANMKVFFSHTSFLFFAVISPITPAKSALSG
jgi:hypothetical protein